MARKELLSLNVTGRKSNAEAHGTSPIKDQQESMMASGRCLS